MNTITQIENALKAINEATFQSLINHLLYLQGNKFIGAPGAVVGKDKTSKGTPDSFFVNNDKYTFVECTTKEKLGASKSFIEKLEKDIDHCFNERETTIKKEQVEKIILACNEKISVKEYELLKTKVQSHNPETEFNIFTIQNLPLPIYEFPILAEEYLKIKIVNGEIYTLEEFLLKTTKGLQPSLTNDFIGRAEELKRSIDALKKQDKLLLSGGAGVGKSKLAVKILEEFSREDYIPIVIQSAAASLWEDFNHLFQAGKKYIVLFDDANKSIQNLNYLLSVIDRENTFSIKVIITSRDYVKKQVASLLSEYAYEEVIISEFKDEEISEIILASLPDLRYNSDIKRRIIALAKGNARVALMATYSVTPDAETNYLSSPVLLYEKYFRKIAEEIGIFNTPIILKALAIVSFFGVLDRSNGELKGRLYSGFGVDWNELWSAIMELHNHEILDVYANEVVKVSDQVLATYAFYKCFMDESSAAINYAAWITAFIGKYAKRISATLIDINNTFGYPHVKDLALPHLNEILKSIHSDEERYAFFDLFWFYKGRECLLYLKKWIEALPQEQMPETLKFSYTHNDHTYATKHFELLHGFWNHADELLKPAVEMTLDLVIKQPSRLPEILKFINEGFKYKLADRDYGYQRQNILLDVLLNENLAEPKRTFANGIFLNLAEALFGWHFTEFGSAKGASITMHNFDLYKSDALMSLRTRMLYRLYDLFNSKSEQISKILSRIVHPFGDIDKSIYIEELPIYQKIISEKLDNTQYAHCKFVKALAKKITQAGGSCPESWNYFIDADIMKLSAFLKPGWEYRDDKTIEEFEKEKQAEFDHFIQSNDWNSIEKFLLRVDDLYKQQTDGNNWHIETAVTDIYISIARKGKSEFKNALRLYFSIQVSFPFRTTVINFALLNNVMTGQELLDMMNDYEFKDKCWWTQILLVMLPEEQINESFLKLLINVFKNPENNISIHRMLAYLKYDKVFEQYKNGKPELEDYNIITYLTSIILLKPEPIRRNFGFHFCQECAPYFTKQLHLLKAAYLAQKSIDKHFDYDGKEFEAVLKLDSNFFIEHLEQKTVDEDYLTFRLENFKIDFIWSLPHYEEMIEKAMNIIIAKSPIFSNWDHPCTKLFTFPKNTEEHQEKALQFLDKYLAKNVKDRGRILVILNIVMYRYHTYFVDFIKKLLLLNKDIEIFSRIYLDRGGMYSGSRVPHIQGQIDFCKELIQMINSLPDTLAYSEHINYLEQRIAWLKKDIKQEQRKDFEEEY